MTFCPVAFAELCLTGRAGFNIQLLMTLTAVTTNTVCTFDLSSPS